MKNFWNVVTIIDGEHEYRSYELLQSADLESADATVQLHVETGDWYVAGDGLSEVKTWSVIEIPKSHYEVLRHYF